MVMLAMLAPPAGSFRTKLSIDCVAIKRDVAIRHHGTAPERRTSNRRCRVGVARWGSESAPVRARHSGHLAGAAVRPSGDTT